MKLVIEIPEYDNESLDIFWEEKSKFSLSIDENTIILSANKNGMISIAKQLLYFAENNLPEGSHVHYSPFFCKNIKSNFELIISEINE